ncbi:uncharacterized protein LOC115075866 isoform X2 [Rhinatrema bivittatum]|uniref:uncharacterized protein LOC115075866 isoform X2 n=1 Tax=Rhinatrema bivittatum TaxID=194408 RepID=UPI00112975F5|nr:uncharacterized protein LOC115075866 isoform X2 [Rhinatrema bivittatum]
MANFQQLLQLFSPWSATSRKCSCDFRRRNMVRHRSTVEGKVKLLEEIDRMGDIQKFMSPRMQTTRAVWSVISHELERKGVQFSAGQCRVTWRDLKHYFFKDLSQRGSWMGKMPPPLYEKLLELWEKAGRPEASKAEEPTTSTSELLISKEDPEQAVSDYHGAGQDLVTGAGEQLEYPTSGALTTSLSGQQGSPDASEAARWIPRTRGTRHAQMSEPSVAEKSAVEPSQEQETSIKLEDDTEIPVLSTSSSGTGHLSEDMSTVPGVQDVSRRCPGTPPSFLPHIHSICGILQPPPLRGHGESIRHQCMGAAETTAHNSELISHTLLQVHQTLQELRNSVFRLAHRQEQQQQQIIELLAQIRDKNNSKL